MSLHLFKHFKTVNKHKFFVFFYACKLGIPFRGFVHDYSKFSFEEFYLSAKYYLGVKSPTVEERKFRDSVSNICMRHTGRNKHHWQYWVDWTRDEIVIARIPYKYSLEYVADILAANRVYNKKEFNYRMVSKYFYEHSKTYFMHPATREFILWCVNELDLKGYKGVKKKITKEKYIEICKKYPNSIIAPLTWFDFDILKMLNEKVNSVF